MVVIWSILSVPTFSQPYSSSGRSILPRRSHTVKPSDIMENTISPLQRAFNAFLLSMPSQQLEDLVKHLHDVKAEEQRQSVFKNEHPSTRADPNSDLKHASSVLPSPKPRPASSRGRKAHAGKRRPLNSFIAFRSK